MEFVYLLIAGLVIGAIAKFLMPGKDPGGCIITILLGIAGAYLGAFIAQGLFGAPPVGIMWWVAAVLAAMLLLLIYRIISGRSR